MTDPLIRAPAETAVLQSRTAFYARLYIDRPYEKSA